MHEQKVKLECRYTMYKMFYISQLNVYFCNKNDLKTTRQLIAAGLCDKIKKHEGKYQGNAPGTQQSVKEKNY